MEIGIEMKRYVRINRRDNLNDNFDFCSNIFVSELTEGSIILKQKPKFLCLCQLVRYQSPTNSLASKTNIFFK